MAARTSRPLGSGAAGLEELQQMQHSLVHRCDYVDQPAAAAAAAAASAEEATGQMAAISCNNGMMVVGFLGPELDAGEQAALAAADNDAAPPGGDDDVDGRLSELRERVAGTRAFMMAADLLLQNFSVVVHTHDAAIARAYNVVSGPLRPFWRPFWLRFTYVPPVLVTKY
eukprot:COSAG01_NODE_2756_length_7129_cov_15.029730_11_plen_170_part_00